MHAADSVCPKCGWARAPGAAECPRCGVLYDRYRPRPARPTTEPAAPRVSLRQRERLLGTLAQTLETGAPLSILLDGPALGDLPAGVSQRIASGLDGGEPLSCTLKALGAVEGASLAMLEAYEQQGRLPAGLTRARDLLAQRRSDLLRMALALAYPVALVLFAGFVLPLPKLFSSGAAAYLQAAAPTVLGVFGAIFACILWSVRAPSSLERFVRGVARRLPIARGAVWHGAIADFVEVLGGSIGAGLPLRAALPLAADSAGHPAFASVREALVTRLDAGASLAQALSLVPRIPAELLGRVHAAEQTGRLEETLSQVSAAERAAARRAAVLAMGALTVLAALGVGAMLVHSIISSWLNVLGETDRAIDDALRQR